MIELSSSQAGLTAVDGVGVEDSAVFFVVVQLRLSGILASLYSTSLPIPFVLVYYSGGDEAPLGVFSYRSPISQDIHLQETPSVQL